MSAMLHAFTRHWRPSLPLALLTAALLAGPAARAQDPQAPLAVAPSGYEVEVIVFRHLGARHTAEIPAPATPNAIMSAGDAFAGRASAADSAPGTPPALAPQSLKLGGIATRLRRGSAYQLLWHGGWMQELTAQDRAQAVALPPEAVRAGATGSITLWRERFVHADVEVGRADGHDGSAPAISQSRRLRGSGVHYFDDPVIGVLLAVRPVGVPASSAP